jgi:hypothetical protein
MRGSLRVVLGFRKSAPAGVDDASQDAEPVDLLHPFYLDTDMSMAFAAALAGGVALEREEVERDSEASQAVRNLRGNLRLFDALGVGGARETTKTDATASESRLVRHHTEASIFIALHDELRRTGRIKAQSDHREIEPGDIVTLEVGPAVAPLRRILEQILRFLDIAMPVLAAESGEPIEPKSAGASRQERRQAARHAVERTTGEDEDGEAIRKIRALFVALREDLDRSGMVDVVINRDDAHSVVLTLDKRFVSDQTLELLHTSRFTVIGKVTQIWPSGDDVVNLHRRSVMSLTPALSQTVTWNLFAMLGTLASSLDVAGAEKAAREAVGLGESEEHEEPTEPSEVMLGDVAVEALNPAVGGPVIQVLPLAICA